MRKLVLGSILAISSIGFAGLTGCGGLTGDNIAKYERGTTPPPPTEAPTDGTYGLYYSTDANPQVQYPLSKGDKLGFEARGADVYAVAGDKEVKVETTPLVRSVYWKKLKPAS